MRRAVELAAALLTLGLAAAPRASAEEPAAATAAAPTLSLEAKPAPASVDANDPSGLKAGQTLSVTPDDTGKVPVTGTLVGLAADRISIARSDARAGDVVVHFPRAGYIVQAS